ncbi:DNA sulfur modification protein DndB [bacterium]|jgi:DNA sulfur modification protein DndB|nr:DNA sulfur modification protein DndB [bacterium]
MSDFFHSFNAVRGIQAGRPCYIAMCPMRIIPKIFVFDEDEVPAELRAQRKLNKGRIPEITNYLIENRNDYTLSSLTASIDGETEFVSMDKSAPNIGTLKISMDAQILLNDGQHRRAAIEEAVNNNTELGHDHISVVFFLDNGLKRSQQMFADLNKHAVRPSPSLATLYDQREELSNIARRVMNEVHIFSRLTETEKTSISNRSIKLFTLSGIKNATKALLNKGKNDHITDKEIQLAIEYWKYVSNQIKDWELAADRKINSWELREGYIHAHGVLLHALGILGNQLINDKSSWIALDGLTSVDWSRNSNNWKGRAVVNGRITKSINNVKLTTNQIKKLINIKLIDNEKIIEQEFKSA